MVSALPAERTVLHGVDLRLRNGRRGGDVAGDAQLTGNLLLPATTPTTGIIKTGPDTLLHSSGTNNLFVGKGAGTLATSGQGGNTASGAYALSSISTAFNNTAIGYGSLMFSTAGSGNAAVGMWSLRDNQGYANTGVGEVTLFKNSGQGNTAIGDAALLYNTSGQFNTAVGYYAGNTNTLANANSTGSNNTFIGYNSGPGSPTQLTNATAIGANARVNQSNSLVLGASGVKVGIGTTTPTSTLDVVGTVNATMFSGDGSGLYNLNNAWTVGGNAGTIPGNDFLGTSDNTAFEIQVNKQRAIRIEPNASSPNIVSGHSSNSVGAAGNYGATVSGGGSATGPNEASAFFSTVSGGWSNIANSQSSTVSGGEFNMASGVTSTVSGGSNNTANGDYSWAGGRQAKTQDGYSTTVHHGAFVWADSAANAAVTGQDFYSMANDEFAVRARGGIRFVTAVNTSGIPTKTTTIDSSGNLISQGSITATGYITNTSDIRLKTDIQPLENTLDKVLKLRGVSYVMKADESKERKIGVIAQELELEYPELVLTDNNGMKSVAYANLTAVLIEAVKGLKVENDALKADLAEIRRLLVGSKP